MKNSTIKKSSFTLPATEVSRVTRLKKRLGLRSNTAVVRRALSELETRVDRRILREQFRESSKLVQKANQRDMEELDSLAVEGLE